MILVFVVAALALLLSSLGVILVIRGRQIIDEWLSGAVLGLAIVLLLCGSACGVLSTIGFIMDAQEYENHICNIISVKTNAEVSGSFCLGTGMVKENLYYYYYHETDKGTIVEKVKAEDTYLIETTETPSLYKCHDKWTADPYYKMYIPVGTIKIAWEVN